MPPIPFVPFDERGDLQIYHHGTLPHWRQHGCTCFVTFRLADSLPAPVLRELTEDRQRWLLNHGIPPDATDWKQKLAALPMKRRQEYEKQIAARLNQHLDRNHGSCVLRDPDIAKLTALQRYIANNPTKANLPAGSCLHQTATYNLP